MRLLLTKLWMALRSKEGQSLVEYALILALVAIVVLSAIGSLGQHARNALNNVNNHLP